MEINYLYTSCALKRLSSYTCMLSMLSYVLSIYLWSATCVLGYLCMQEWCLRVVCACHSPLLSHNYALMDTHTHMYTHTHTLTHSRSLTVDSTEVALVITPSSDTIEVHSTVLLVCVAQGDPSPSITWDFEGTLITNETSFRVRSLSSEAFPSLSMNSNVIES